MQQQVRHRASFSGDEDPFADQIPATFRSLSHLGAPSSLGESNIEDANEFEELVNTNPDAILVHQRGRVSYCNAAAIRLFGAHSSSEIIGHELNHFFTPNVMPYLLSLTAKLKQSGDATSVAHVRLRRFDDTELEVEAIVALTKWNGEIGYQFVMRALAGRISINETFELQASLVEYSHDAIIAVTKTGMVVSWNPAAEILYGRPKHRALALPIDVAVGAPIQLDSTVLNRGVIHGVHYTMDGIPRRVRLSVSQWEDGYVLVGTDQTHLERTRHDLQAVMDTLQEGVALTLRNGHIQMINAAAFDILGLDKRATDAANGSNFFEIELYDSEGALVNPPAHPLQIVLTTGLPIIGKLFGVNRQDGTRAWLSLSCRPLEPEKFATSRLIVTFSDITSYRNSSEYLTYQASHDSLTGLPNRAHIVETIAAIRRVPNASAALLFIDIDDLKTVNDTLGHAIGDLVIGTLAERLRNAVRRHDFVGRFAGDEFVAVLRSEVAPDQTLDTVDRIQKVLTEPIQIPDGAVTVGASIGTIFIEADDPRDAAALLHDADTAMYVAKARARRATDIVTSTTAVADGPTDVD